MKLSTLSRTKVCAAISVAFCTLPAFAQVEAKLTGRIHYDFRNINDGGLPNVADKDSASVADNFELRRARIGFVGSINKDLQFEAVANTVGSSTNFIDTAFINYGYNKQAQFRAGRFKQPFSLEEMTSSNNTDFMERSYVNQMVPQKKLGAMFHGEVDNGITYGVSVYQNDFNEISNTNPAGTMGALRVTSNLAKLGGFGGEDTVVHFGAGLVKGKYEQVATTSNDTGRGTADTFTRSTIVSFRDENRGMSNVYRLQIGGDNLATNGFGLPSNNVAVVSQSMPGYELAIAQGPFKFQAEFANSKFSASQARCLYTDQAGDTCSTFYGTATVSAVAKAQYLSFVWNITGENFAKSYSKGAWGGIKPNEEFMKDYGGVVGKGLGAFQLAYRYSTYSVTLADANTAGALGTKNAEVTQRTLADGSSTNKSRIQNSPTATTQTIGLNWIFSQNARIMFDYSDTKFGSAVKYLDVTSNAQTTTSEKVFSARTQINF